MEKIFAILVMLVSPLVIPAYGKPQLITLRDGKIGVNFAGYHAEAGLGGLLTGNAAHGGLSASAGTPHGQKAGAGLGGSVDGRTAGGLYAGASAGHGVGASAALGGKVDEYGAYGGEGAEAHAGGVSKKVVKLGSNGVTKEIASVQYPGAGARVPYDTVEDVVDTRFADQENEVPVAKLSKHKATQVVQPPPPLPTKVQKKKVTVQKIYHTQPEPTLTHSNEPFDYKHFLDFGFFSNLGAQYGGAHVPGGHQVIIEKTQIPAPVIHKQVHVHKRIGNDGAGGVAGSSSISSGTGYPGVPSSQFFDSIFNIPISTLSAVSSFLGGLGGTNGAVSKTVAYTS